MRYDCFECGLPDLHNGDGDGIGSCQCPRCDVCAGPPGCTCDDYDDDSDILYGYRPVAGLDVTGERL